MKNKLNRLLRPNMSIYFSAMDEVVQKLAPNLREAVERGLKIVVITESPFVLENAQVYQNREPSTQVRLITDSSHALTGDYINVENKNYKKVYTGKVIGENRVLVNI